jgi:hypothetical protein
MTEAQTGSRGTQTTHAARPPLILAADDRNSLERSDGSAPPTSAPIQPR